MQKIFKKIIDGNTDEGRHYPIQPESIDTQKTFAGAFGHIDTAISARIAVELAQKNGGWMPFSKDNINEYCGELYKFNRLSTHDDPMDSRNFIVMGEDGLYRYTHEFICVCYINSPFFGEEVSQ